LHINLSLSIQKKDSLYAFVFITITIKMASPLRVGLVSI